MSTMKTPDMAKLWTRHVAEGDSQEVAHRGSPQSYANRAGLAVTARAPRYAVRLDEDGARSALPALMHAVLRIETPEGARLLSQIKHGLLLMTPV